MTDEQRNQYSQEELNALKTHQFELEEYPIDAPATSHWKCIKCGFVISTIAHGMEHRATKSINIDDVFLGQDILSCDEYIIKSVIH